MVDAVIDVVVFTRKCSVKFEKQCSGGAEQKCATVTDTINEQQCQTQMERKCENVNGLYFCKVKK